MISLAKKLLGTTGRGSSSTSPVGESRVRKYSLTSSRELTPPVSGTSFSLNPEHSFVTPDRSKISDEPAGGKITPLSQRAEPEASFDSCDGTEGEAFAMCSEIRSRCIADDARQADDYDLALSKTDEDFENCADDVAHPRTSVGGFGLWKDNLVNVMTDARCESATLNTRLSSSTFDEFLDSQATISSDDFASVVSMDLIKPTSKYQRVMRKKKQTTKDLRFRRRTVDNIDFDRTSARDSVAEDLARSKSISLSPSPIGDRPNQWRKVPRRISAARRRTVVGLFADLDASESLNETAEEIPSSLINVVYPNSSEDLLTDCSSVEMLGDRRCSLGRKTAAFYGRRRRNVTAVAVCLDEMKRCKVIADLDLLEDNTEFEPCRMPFEATVVLWPTAVDKPSYFEYLGTNHSWISSLEAIGFVGAECLLMASASFSQGLRDHSLFLLLFPQHLLFAEQKSNSTLRLDWKINVSRLWLSSRKVDAAEVAETDAVGDGSRSFVIGWPPMNAVLTFATSNEKTLWTAKLEEHIATQKEKDENKELDIRVVYKERGLSKLKDLVVSSIENSFQFLQRCLQEFHLNVNNSKDYQLFIRWSKVHREQPLLGHESPYMIGAWFLSSAAKQRKENSHLQCLVLRERKRVRRVLNEAGGRNRASELAALKTLFKRSQWRSQRSTPLFGIYLSEICTGMAIPGRIQAMFQFLYVHGPSTVGVFRKSGRHKELNDFKAYLNSVEEIDFENISVDVVASAIKDWLRNLPDCLLSCSLYNQWISVSELSNSSLMQDELKRLSLSLEPSHLLVLRHLMCVLHRIQLHSKYNRMTPANLAVCIGPNILHRGTTAEMDLLANSVMQANGVVRLLIESVDHVLGSDCIRLYQDLADPEAIEITEIDGDYELHQVVSAENASTISTQNCDQGDYCLSNSLESLSNDFTVENSTLTTSQSLDNMSPDSGLAASNPQLYEDILVATSGLESGCRKSQQPQKDSLSRAELFDILEDQLAPESIDASLSSQASNHYNGIPISAEKMDVGRNVNEHLQQHKNLEFDFEGIVDNFEGRFSIPQEQVGLSDGTEQAASFLSRSLLPEAEVQCSSHDNLLSSFPLGTDVKAMPLVDLTMLKIDNKKKHMSKSVAALNDDVAKKTADLSGPKTPQYCCRLIGVEIVPVTKSNALRESTSVQTKVTEKGSTVFAVSSPTVGRKVGTSPEKFQHKYIDGVKMTAGDNDSPIKRERLHLQSRENPAVVTSHVSKQRPLDSEKGTALARGVHVPQYREVNSSSTKMAELSLNSNSSPQLSVDNGQFSRVNDTSLLVTVTRSRQRECDKAKHSNMQQVVDKYDVCQKALDVNPRLGDTRKDPQNFKCLNERSALVPDRVSGTGIRHNGSRKDAICKPRQFEDNDPCQTKKNSAYNPPDRPVVTGTVNSHCSSGNVTIISPNCPRENGGPKTRHAQTGLGNYIGEVTPTNKGIGADDRQVTAWRGGGITGTAVARLPHPKCPNLNTQTVGGAPCPDGFNQRNGPRMESRSVEMHRRTTVIQLCDNSSVILQKTLKKT